MEVRLFHTPPQLIEKVEFTFFVVWSQLGFDKKTDLDILSE